MYNPVRQFRCTIVRGKSQNEMDNLLPLYAQTIVDTTPCLKRDFEDNFNKLLRNYLTNATKKTLDNHRTEIAGKLFGMFYIDQDEVVYPSQRTLKFLEDHDQPAFFKDMCFKIQFPNGMSKIDKIQQLVDNRINCRPYSYILATLVALEKNAIVLNKKEIGYYLLNSLDVLQGNANIEEIVEFILKDKKSNIKREIPLDGKASSYVYQHINEQLNYLVLANLIQIESGYVYLNNKEKDAIECFVSVLKKPLSFNIYSYFHGNTCDTKDLYLDWGVYYSNLSDDEYNKKFTTSIKALLPSVPEDSTPSNKKAGSTVELGDEGERYVYEKEKLRVSKFNPRFENKVLYLGKTKGLGFDIQSVLAEDGMQSEFVKYIEVKATKRVTAPDFSDPDWFDSVNITRNEWIAATQHKEFYSIYRVYFTRSQILVYSIENVYRKSEEKDITVSPIMYRIDFNKSALRKVNYEEL